MPEVSLRNLSAGIVPLSKETLQDRVYRQVSELILDGSFIPGETVTVQSLADAFGVSPMPVREALRRLTTENALMVVSGRSIGIPKLSRSRLTDLRNVRVEFEATAGAWASKYAKDGDLAVLRHHLDELEAANATGDRKAYVRANRAFHFAIYRLAGSDILFHFIETLWLQISPYFHLLQESGNYSTANSHHRAMFEAIRDRDGDRIRQAIAADIDAAYAVLSGLLK